MQNPIEIRPTDLIERPIQAAVGAVVKPPGMLDRVKGILDMVKQLKGLEKELKDAGIDLRGMMGGQSAGDQPSVEQLPAAPGPNGKQQLGAFIMMLRMKYGDISIDELLAKLRAEYGMKKLSEFIAELLKQ